MKIKEDIPVTLLYQWLTSQATEELNDTVSALALLPEDSSELLKEKAMAAVALQNSKAAFTQEPHGFANVCLIMNGVFPVVEFIPQVSVQYLNYAVWEIIQGDPELVIHPNVVNFIKACMDTEDFVYPPDNLQFLGDIYVEKYKDAAITLSGIYGNYAKNSEIEKDIDGLDDFYKFHLGKLLSVDSYTEKMQTIYKKYQESLKE